MKVESLRIPEVKLVTPPRYTDPRGFFSETWKQGAFAEAGIPGPFIQDNHAYSNTKGVLRGLHCQIGPNAQGKLVRCVRGAIYDVAVDARHGSPTYGQWAGAEIGAANGTQIWVPKRNCRIYAGAYYASRPAIQAARNWAAKNPRNR